MRRLQCSNADASHIRSSQFSVLSWITAVAARFSRVCVCLCFSGHVASHVLYFGYMRVRRSRCPFLQFLLLPLYTSYSDPAPFISFLFTNWLGFFSLHLSPPLSLSLALFLFLSLRLSPPLSPVRISAKEKSPAWAVSRTPCPRWAFFGALDRLLVATLSVCLTTKQFRWFALMCVIFVQLLFGCSRSQFSAGKSTQCTRQHIVENKSERAQKKENIFWFKYSVCAAHTLWRYVDVLALGLAICQDGVQEVESRTWPKSLTNQRTFFLSLFLSISLSHSLNLFFSLANRAA